MSVEVHWFATLIKRTRSRQQVTTVPWRAGLTPLQILLDEGLSDTDAEAVLPVIDEKQIELTDILTDGAVLELLVSIAGGAPASVGVDSRLRVCQYPERSDSSAQYFSR
jgi:hypothetical protein